MSARLSIVVAGSVFCGFTVAELRERDIPEGDILVGVKSEMKRRIDDQAEALRNAVITPGTGQAMEYQEAQAQAFAALAAPETAEGRYPMLDASIGVDIDPQTGLPAVDALGVARSIKAAYDRWQTVGAAIRGIRLRAKGAIDAAGTIDAAQDAFDAIDWPPL